MKLVKKVGNFLREVAQLAELAEPYFIGAYHLLPPQGTPSNVMAPTAKQLVKQLVGDVKLPLCTGPDIAADFEAAAQVCKLGRSIRLLCEQTLPDLHSRNLRN